VITSGSVAVEVRTIEMDEDAAVPAKLESAGAAAGTDTGFTLLHVFSRGYPGVLHFFPFFCCPAANIYSISPGLLWLNDLHFLAFLG
jgi:hypothetical protein